ncbi:MAG: hypothetical protein U0X76_04545 [Bacteroidia bacterium]
MSEIGKSWKGAFSHPSFRNQFVLTFLVLLSFAFIFPYFFDFIEARNGPVMTDILLEQLPAMDVSLVVFFFLYSGIVVGLISHLSHPKAVLLAFQTYVLITLVRMLSITLFPLNPPVGYIPLREPFVSLFTTNGRIISRDLFFSGHMSTILSILFATHKVWIRRYLILCASMIGMMILPPACPLYN